MAAILDFRSKWFSYFWSKRRPDMYYQVSSQLAFQFRRRSSKWIIKMVAILDFDQNDFSCFWSTNRFDTSYQVWSQMTFPFWRRSSKCINIFIFGGSLGFRIGTILAIFWSASHPILHTKFRVIGSTGWEDFLKCVKLTGGRTDDGQQSTE